MSLDVLGILNERAGCGLELTGVIEEGQSGAAYVRWPDGRDGVVTTAFASIDLMRLTAEVLAKARAAGIPVPAHEFLYDLGDGRVGVVQERMPGTLVTRATAATVDAIVEVNERFAGMLTGRAEIDRPRLSLGRPGDPIPTEPVERHSQRARHLLRAIRRTAGEGTDVPGDDLVHVDLTVPNMLFDPSGLISGVIDWNYGVARGDRHYGLVKLLHTLSFDAATQRSGAGPTLEAVERAEQAVMARLEPETFRRYWAHQTLNMLYASHRWGTEQAFIAHLGLGESKLL